LSNLILFESEVALRLESRTEKKISQTFIMSVAFLGSGTCQGPGLRSCELVPVSQTISSAPRYSRRFCK